MTRGQIAIIVKDYKEKHILTSTEFNGDMYMKGGYGQLAVNALKRSKDVARYQYEVAKFNLEHHHYNDLDALTYKLKEDCLDFTKDYFQNWFSDYVYIKNLTLVEVTIKTSITDKEGRDIGKKEVVLKPKAIAVLCFGKLVKLIEEE